MKNLALILSISFSLITASSSTPTSPKVKAFINQEVQKLVGEITPAFTAQDILNREWLKLVSLMKRPDSDLEQIKKVFALRVAILQDFAIRYNLFDQFKTLEQQFRQSPSKR